jgi:hypothetical protein
MTFPQVPRRLCASAAFALAFVAFGAVQVAHNAHLFRTPVYEHSDYAANSLLVLQAKRGELLHGHYSRIGFYHPGPAALYWFAGFELVLHDALGAVPAPHNAHMIGHLLLNAALLAIGLSVLWRAFGTVPALAAVVAILGHLSVTGALASHWFAHLFFMAYLPFLFVAASVAAGRVAHLGWLALTASFCVHVHASLVAFVVPISLYALVRVCWRVPLTARAKRAWIAFGATVALFVLPIALHTALHYPGEIKRYLDYKEKAKDKPPPGTPAEAARYMLRSLTDDSRYAGPLAAGVGLGAVFAALTFPARGRRFARQVLVVVLLTTGAMAYYTRRGIDSYSDEHLYLGYFYSTVLLAGVVLIVARVALAARAAVPAPALAVGCACAAAAFALTGAFTNPYTGSPEFARAAEEIAADPRWEHGPPLVTVHTGGWTAAAGLLVELERRGKRPAALDRTHQLLFTPAFAAPEAQPALVWQFDCAPPSAPAVPVRRALFEFEGMRVCEVEPRAPLGAPLELSAFARAPGLKPYRGWLEFSASDKLLPIAPRAVLLLDVEPNGAQRVRLELDAEPVAPKRSEAGQRVRVRVNGAPIGEMVFPLGGVRGHVLELSGALLRPTGPTVIEFEFPDALPYRSARGPGPAEVYSVAFTRVALTPVP